MNYLSAPLLCECKTPTFKTIGSKLLPLTPQPSPPTPTPLTHSHTHVCEYLPQVAVHLCKGGFLLKEVIYRTFPYWHLRKLLPGTYHHMPGNGRSSKQPIREAHIKCKCNVYARSFSCRLSLRTSVRTLYRGGCGKTRGAGDRPQLTLTQSCLNILRTSA